MAFPAHLKRLRVAAKLSQEQLAHAIGRAGQSAISNYESGNREPTLSELPSLASALGVPITAFFDESAPSQPAGFDDATMAQAVELLHMLADLRPDDVRFRRVSWQAIKVTAKAIARAEGSQKDAVRMILEELSEV